jgi:hypothetical protein
MKSNSPQSASKSFDSMLLKPLVLSDYSLTWCSEKTNRYLNFVALYRFHFDLPSTTTEMVFIFTSNMIIEGP